MGVNAEIGKGRCWGSSCQNERNALVVNRKEERGAFKWKSYF